MNTTYTKTINLGVIPLIRTIFYHQLEGFTIIPYNPNLKQLNPNSDYTGVIIKETKQLLQTPVNSIIYFDFNPPLPRRPIPLYFNFHTGIIKQIIENFNELISIQLTVPFYPQITPSN